MNIRSTDLNSDDSQSQSSLLKNKVQQRSFLFAKMQMHHFTKQLLFFSLWSPVDHRKLYTVHLWPLLVHLWKVELFLVEVNICRWRSLWMCWGLGTCLCRTLYRTERIRMKYWVHLWISGAERPLVGASACIFSWWKPLDGSFLLAASLNSESQKCNAPDEKRTKIYRDGTLARFSFALVQTLDNDSECVCVCVCV